MDSLELNPIWKRIDFGSRSIRIDYQILRQFLRTKAKDLRKKLRSERYDMMVPNLPVRMIAFCHEEGHLRSTMTEDICVYQHLKTGYYEEIFVYVEEYRQLMTETGLIEERRTMKIHDFERLKNMPTKKSEKHKRIEVLEPLIYGKICFIMEDVRQGIPLKGYCDHCPLSKVKIEQ